MADDDELSEAELTADEVLTFGPCVEAQVWTPAWLQEARSPIAVSAGRPKLGRVFDDDGVGRMVAIRPCMSRGRRVRGLPPIYTPQMLEANAGVFDGWPMFTDHAPAAVTEALAKHGRSVKELGGQVIRGHWQRDFVQESDGDYGYRKGGVICSVWATPLVRKIVGNNPGLLHTSINAWPTSGKPGPCPWRPGVKGMLIEGIRKQPQGSVDYVVRGGAGGRLLVAEGLEDEGAWPEVGEWSDSDVRLVVSVAESLYANSQMAEITLPSNPDELREWMQEHAPHLLPALVELDAEDEPLVKALMKRGKSRKEAEAAVSKSSEEKAEEGLSEADVLRIMQESQQGLPTVEEFEQRLREETQRTIEERDAQRELAGVAAALIESAVGIPAGWKADLKARYAMLPSGPPATLLAESETDAEGNELTPRQVVEARVEADLDRVRDLLAEATGKPRVKGEGARSADAGEDGRGRGEKKGAAPYWRQRFASMGLAESEDKAAEALGIKVEG